jgi:endo-1,3(4)-beta-glucanase
VISNPIYQLLPITAFYNDQHFHYGYHIYAAAVVAHFDPAWGRKYFEQVLLLVRSIANPSRDDKHFPLYRHKDWYRGSSWASGVPNPPYLNGKNQESSSEAIAAYESVALYGQVMVSLNRSEQQ